MCGKGDCKCARISDIHSGIGREIKRSSKTGIRDDLQTAACRTALSKTPEDPEALMNLGDALAFQMRYREALIYYEKAKALYPEHYGAHRKCAVRYMSIMDIEKCERELLWCDERTSDKGDTGYLLALCKYYKGDYKGAEELFGERRKYAEENDEMNIAYIYWIVLCRVKQNSDVSHVLSAVKEDMDAGHHTGYMQAVRLFQTGDISSMNGVDGEDELNVMIYLYGLYHYYLYAGKKIAAEIILGDVLKLDKYFSAFAYLGAYSEKILRGGENGVKIDTYRIKPYKERENFIGEAVEA